MHLINIILGIASLVAFVQSAAFQIKFSARNLANMDILNGAPDAYVRVTQAEGSRDVYRKVGETETIQNSNDPNWKQTFDFNFVIGANQRLRFELYDKDINRDDYMGRADINFPRIVNPRNGTLELNITDCPKPNCGRLILERTT